MGVAWTAGDAAISRAGAGSVAEAWANAVPTIFVPNPHHRDEHQHHNARPLVEAGGAVIVEDATALDITAQRLAAPLFGLVRDQTRRAAMRTALERSRPDSGADVVARWAVDQLTRDARGEETGT